MSNRATNQQHKYLNLKLTALLGSKGRLKDYVSMASTQRKSGFPPNLGTPASLGIGTLQWYTSIRPSLRYDPGSLQPAVIRTQPT
ncbi:hypothetical protein CHU98_g5893 [Xylaria longipes]|nr:hypothetical protein CHU98_g5893 [Xylaria longipes]